jgi:putative Holliday junction resolvase
MTARFLALDVGERRVGVALSDSIGMLARPLKTIVRGSREADFQAIAGLVKDYAVEKIVVGLPLSLNGTEGPQAKATRRYSERLGQALDVPIEYWDERFSSLTAVEILNEKGQRGHKTRGDVDSIAAAVILQSYLDAHISSLKE